MEFSALLPVYAKESVGHFQDALESIAVQSRLPSELVIVADGPLTYELKNAVEAASRVFPCPLRYVEYPRNRGLGEVLADGLKECAHELVLRCDSDDINLKTRFEIQVEVMARISSLAVYGGQIREFGDDSSVITGRRAVPCSMEAVRKCAYRRNPVNHMTVALRRSMAIRVGNYIPMHGYEDYYLWMRMLHAGFAILNSPEDLVLARAGAGMLNRRRGWKMFRAEYEFQMRLVQDRIFPLRLGVENVLLRGGIRLLPARLLRVVYRRYARVAP
jgi:glycosyltransferase involved in cell wall biosynthesis